jgi:acetylornithine deacetylase/succinyl-diaminopimelate desuccinylase family protein
MPATITSELSTLFSDLIRINSVNPAYDPTSSEAAIQKFVAKYLVDNHLDITEQPVLPGRPNIIAKIPGKNPERRIIFEAHCDTAGTTGMTVPAFTPETRDGFMYGRGSCDIKAGLAAMILALVELKRSGRRPPSEVWVVSAVDEEHSYRGVWELRKELKASAAVVAEPTEMKMAVASKGCLRWRIRVTGKAAHSSKPHLGINAIEHMSLVIQSLRGHERELAVIKHPLLGSPTLNVGIIHGGTQVNVVPETCWIEVDRRLIPGEEPEQVFQQYSDLLAAIRTEQNVDVSAEPPSLVDWPLETSETSSIVLHTSRALRSVGLYDRGVGVPFGSDASKLANAGIPSIILGPGSIDQAHTANEFVSLEQVQMAFEVYREIMRNFE